MAGQHIFCRAETLSVLEVFRAPRTLEDALHLLGADSKGVQAWVALTSTIHHLYQVGLLREPERLAAQLGSQQKHFDAAPIHVMLLNDRVRTEDYLAAIREVVRPGEVVVDIGTGTGVLAIGAALAGARHVYAIEASGIGKAAQRVFEANGLADRITLIEGWSTQVELPEKADVLVSELISNDTFGEEVLQVTTDALQRLLRPGARLIPSAVATFGLPVQVPAGWLAATQFVEMNTSQWREWYQIDFSPLADVGHGEVLRLFAHSADVAQWPTFAPPTRLAHRDLTALAHAGMQSITPISVQSEGEVNGIVTYFEIDLSPAVRLSTQPTLARRPTSWSNPVWVFPARRVGPGDLLQVQLQSNHRGDVTLDLLP